MKSHRPPRWGGKRIKTIYPRVPFRPLNAAETSPVATIADPYRGQEKNPPEVSRNPDSGSDLSDALTMMIGKY